MSLKQMSYHLSDTWLYDFKKKKKLMKKH